MPVRRESARPARASTRFGLLDSATALADDFVHRGQALLELVDRGRHPAREDRDTEEQQALTEVSVP